MILEKKPARIDAIQWDGHNTDEIRCFCGSGVVAVDPVTGLLHIAQEKPLVVYRGAWVARGTCEFYIMDSMEVDEGWRVVADGPTGYKLSVARALQEMVTDALRNGRRDQLCPALADLLWVYLPPSMYKSMRIQLAKFTEGTEP